MVVTMSIKAIVLVCLVASCSSEPSSPPVDPCQVEPMFVGGTAEVGLGSEFSPIMDGQDVQLIFGYRNLYTVVVNARVQDMDIGADDRPGVVFLTAFDEGGQVISLDLSCRVREFVETATADGTQQLDSPYNLPLHPSFTPSLEGARIKIRLDVRDQDGIQAIDERTVVAHLPLLAGNAL